MDLIEKPRSVLSFTNRDQIIFRQSNKRKFHSSESFILSYLDPPENINLKIPVQVHFTYNSENQLSEPSLDSSEDLVKIKNNDFLVLLKIHRVIHIQIIYKTQNIISVTSLNSILISTVSSIETCLQPNTSLLVEPSQTNSNDPSN